jgi:hypothetical protein
VLAPRNLRALGWGEGAGRPVAALQFLSASGAEGSVYVAYTDGAYVMHALHPRVRPVMDSRIDVYGEALYAEYTASRTSREAFARYLAAHDVAIVMLPPTFEREREWIATDPTWRLAYDGDDRGIWLR